MKEAILETKGLTKRYGSILAVDDLTFEVYKGESLGFLGPNGAGKTTTIRMLTGQITPTSGEIKVAGFNIGKEAIKAKERVGIVPDSSTLYDEMSAWDNLMFSAQLYDVPKKERRMRGKELLEDFGLHDRCKDRVGKFSRGMKRRVAIAAALIHDPEILFLDEPTTGLDVQSARMIRKRIDDLNKKGTTLFLTTHYIEEADQLCQRVAILDHGKIVVIDKPEKLKASVSEKHVIEISYDSLDNLEKNLGNLNEVNKVSRVGDKYRLLVGEASVVIPALIDFSRENGIRVISIKTLNPSLEDAFVKYTGISLENMTGEKEASKNQSNEGRLERTT